MSVRLLTVAVIVAALGLVQGPATALPIETGITPVDETSNTIAPPSTTTLPAPAQPGAVTILDGGDGYLNAGEVPAVTVTGTYDNTDPLITQVIVRVTNSIVCAVSTPGTSTQNATLNPDGTWTAGPFDLSGSLFAEGVEVCARARSQYSNGEQSAATTSNTPVKDTIAPLAGTVAYSGAYAADGFINIAEAAAPDPGGRPVTWAAGDGTASAAEARFTDAADAIPAGSCGVFALSASGAGYLNAGCLAALADGEVRWQARWRDAAANWTTWEAVSITLDRVAPTASIELLDNDGKVSTPEAGSGVPVTWSVSETGPNVAISAANAGDPAPAQCSWPDEARAATGAVTASCFAVLLDGPIEVAVSGTDAAGNPASALDTSEIDRLGPDAPIVSIDTDPINASNVGSVSVTVDGGSGMQAAVTLEDEDGNQTTQSTTLASPVSLSFDLSGFVDGSITATAVLTDADGNPSAAATDTVLKDSIAPVPGNVAYAGPYATDGFVNIAEAAAPDPSGRPVTWAAGDPAATAAEGRFTDTSDAIILGGSCGVFALGADGTGYLNSSCMSVVPQGEVRWQVRWRDAAGNWSDWVSTSILVDTVAPTVVIDSPTGGETFAVGATVPVEGSTEADAPLTYEVDGADAGDDVAAADGSWATSVAPQPDGVHTFTVGTADTAGNPGSASVLFEVDRNIPIIITPIQDAFVSTLVTIGGGADVGSEIEVFEGALLLGSTQADASGVWTLVSGLTEGVHSIRARGTDLDDTVSEFSAVRTFTVDAGRPTLSITTADLTLFPLGPALTGTAGDDDGVARIEITYFNAFGGNVLTQDAACPTCGLGALTANWTADPDLGPGLYSIQAVAIDVVGNRSPIRTIRFITL